MVVFTYIFLPESSRRGTRIFGQYIVFYYKAIICSRYENTQRIISCHRIMFKGIFYQQLNSTRNHHTSHCRIGHIVAYLKTVSKTNLLQGDILLNEVYFIVQRDKSLILAS